MSVNLAALAAIKASFVKKNAEREQLLEDSLCELGLETDSRSAETATLASVKASIADRNAVRNCGNCVSWENCTVAHRRHFVSPNLSACGGHRFLNENTY